jgi:citrate lyase subunit beta/citryl-CoA lyase
MKGKMNTPVEQRIFFYVPGYKPAFIEVAVHSIKTNLILCLEDGTPKDKKHEARYLVKGALKAFANKCDRFIVRINSVYTDYWRRDIEAILQHPPKRIRIPMVNKPEDLLQIDHVVCETARRLNLPELPQYEVMIESREGLRNLKAIAATNERIYAFTLGAGDYLDDVKNCRNPHEELKKAREYLAGTCRELGIYAFDSTYMNYKDIDGFYKDCIASREFGFSGRSVIHPDQVNLAIEVYSQTG